MHPHQSSDKFFELFDSCQQMIESIRFDISHLRRCHNTSLQLKSIKDQVEQLQKCSFEFASISINEVFYDFCSRVQLNNSDKDYIESVAILTKELEPAYTEFFQQLRSTQSLSSSGYYYQKNNKRDIL